MTGLGKFPKSPKPIAATVLIPTFGEARFARWAIESVRRQTIQNIEIFIICDGSPPQMVSFFKVLAAEDSRIKVCSFEKSERAGEPYRDLVIRKKARGPKIFYCAHDDLWFPKHIEELSELLDHKSFAHSIHVWVKGGELQEDAFIGKVFYADLAIAGYLEQMQNVAVPTNYFGLTCAAHTRKAYLRLKEGWTTTPPGIWTDLHMWRKFLARFPSDCGTSKRVSALSFPTPFRREWSEQEREAELAFYFNRMLEPDFINKVNDLSWVEATADLAATVASRDRELTDLTATVASRDRELTDLMATVASRDRELAELTATVASRDRELTEIKISKAWRLGLMMRRIRLILAPQNSRRARALRTASRVLARFLS